MAKVFITQIPCRKDYMTGRTIPKIDISPAAEHGEIVELFPYSMSIYSAADLVRDLRKGLADYDAREGDSLIALGDPAIIAAAGAVLGAMGKSFRLLKWDRKIEKYIPVLIQI